MKWCLAAISLICISIAAYMAIKGKEGWRWFLFVGLLIAGAAAD